MAKGGQHSARNKENRHGNHEWSTVRQSPHTLADTREQRADREIAACTSRKARSAHELLEDRVLRLVVESVTKLVKHLLESSLLVLGHLDPGEHLAHLAAVVTVVQQREEELAGGDARKELLNRARTHLRELEAQDALAFRVGPAAHEVARVRLRHLIGSDVHHFDADGRERVHDAAHLLLSRKRVIRLHHAHVDHGPMARVVAVHELSDGTRLYRLVHAVESAGFVGQLERKEALLLLAHGRALGDEAQDVELDVRRVR
mmetsp:Transcript_60151/g.137963  ORF Transcript_60151/g.137963 Transcript_60151/m.137963 type:complete len:260 (-) Transcript_60151:1291-2070(-)